MQETEVKEIIDRNFLLVYPLQEMNILERGKPPEQFVMYPGEALTKMGRFFAAQVLESLTGGIISQEDSSHGPKLGKVDVCNLLSQGIERVLAGKLQLIPTDMHVLGAARRKAAEAKSALREKDTAEGRQLLTIYTRAVDLLEGITKSP